MTNEEIMSRIVSAFEPVDRSREDHKTELVVTVRHEARLDSYGKRVASAPSRVTWEAALIHDHGRGAGFAETLTDALHNLLRNLRLQPLTMAQHDAMQALRVEVGL